MEFLWQLDSRILLWIQSLRQDWMTPFWKGITFLGDYGWFWIVLALAFLCFRQTRKTGVAVLLALLTGALITNVVLKPLFARTRPYEVIEGLVLLVHRQKDYSFPSGHSCAAFAGAAVCYRRLPRPYGTGLLILAGLLAFSRLYVGVHYPSDVLGGIMTGLLAAWTALKISSWYSRKVSGSFPS